MVGSMCSKLSRLQSESAASVRYKVDDTEFRVPKGINEPLVRLGRKETIYKLDHSPKLTPLTNTSPKIPLTLLATCVPAHVVVTDCTWHVSSFVAITLNVFCQTAAYKILGFSV
ncbi:hypothetical protein F2Q70_00016294 [Brassica cretica]|uniref:Uncharacterized protein n=1 Tax=Brassica cretica TaxID=69181 RepID=A0A8S9HUF5_BRACR|nr:hypothetical protein F2Q70_00016294 [Brassica cretica]